MVARTLRELGCTGSTLVLSSSCAILRCHCRVLPKCLPPLLQTALAVHTVTIGTVIDSGVSTTRKLEATAALLMTANSKMGHRGTLLPELHIRNKMAIQEEKAQCLLVSQSLSPHRFRGRVTNPNGRCLDQLP